MTAKIIPANYGSIPHLPSSRLGPGDHYISNGQADLLTKKERKDIWVIVQEKLDGSNVGVLKQNGKLIPLSRKGFTTDSSPYKQHKLFSIYVKNNYYRFNTILNEGERIVGEWLAQAHGTIYDLYHEPFIAFDIFNNDNKRLIYDNFLNKINNKFLTPALLSNGRILSEELALSILGNRGFHGAISSDGPEGAIWRAERNNKVEFLAKYVKSDKIDGKYMKQEIWNNNLDKYLNLELAELEGAIK